MSCEQYLIQSLMWKQCVSEDNFRRMAIKCLKVDGHQDLIDSQVTEEILSQLVKKVNKNIRPFHMEISRRPNETDGTKYYALINNADNEITRLANYWSQKELIYFQRLLSAIIESPDSIVRSTSALNIGREEDIKFTMTAAESLINKWVEHKWLEETENGSLSVGVRSLLELDVYIKRNFEIQDCFRCKALCIRGSNCMSCDTKLHFHCVDSKFIPNNKCPNCSKDWSPNAEQLSAGPSTRNSGEIFNSNNVYTEDTDEEEEEVIERPKRNKRSKQ